MLDLDKATLQKGTFKTLPEAQRTQNIEQCVKVPKMLNDTDSDTFFR